VQAVTVAWTLAQVAIRSRITFAHLATVSEGYFGLHLKRRFGIPFMVYAHGNEIAALADRFTPARWNAPLDSLREAHRVIAVSRETASRVVRLGIPAEKVCVVYPGCDVALFRPLAPDEELRRRILGSKSNHRVILTVANLVERKGHDVVIRSLPLIRETVPDVVYLIVGIGAHRSTLEQLAVEVGVRDHVVFLGAAERSLLPALYAMADVFAMTSRTREDAADLEGFGLVYLEAAACAKAVVAGRAGGAPEAVVDGETGLLVDPREPNDVGRALTRLLVDAEMRERMAAEGYRRVQRHFVWSRFSRDILALMDESTTGLPSAAVSGV
jgi:phosphatidylinositol alpha-1,6-mannosyltransferase